MLLNIKIKNLPILLRVFFLLMRFLVAKAILFSKAVSGVSARIGDQSKIDMFFGDSPFSQNLVEAREISSKLAPFSYELARNYSDRLGISKDRFMEIEEYVYSNEGML